ncbi:MAG: hypothetical protein WCJ33_03320 [Pseudomonadota bacterium]
MSDSENNKSTIYNWNLASAIKSVETKAGIAYINAADQVDNLQQVIRSFRQQGWIVAPATRNGKPVLRLSGFDKSQEILDIIQDNNYVEGSPNIQIIEKEEKKSSFEELKSSSLRASGIFYELGNILYMAEGFFRKDWAGVGVGAAFATGDSLLVAFGGNDQEKAIKSLLKNLKKHLNDNGIEIPEGSALNAETLAKPNGFLEQIYDFIHEHVNSFKNLAEVAGGIFMIFSGMKSENKAKSAAGAVIITGFLAAELIQEKKIDAKEYEKLNPVEKVWSKIQSNPLALAGAAGLINNAFNVVGYANERKKVMQQPEGERKNHYKIGSAAVASMLVANTLYSVSKKTRGNEDSDIINDVYAMAAQAIAEMPEKIREKAIEETSMFLAERNDIKDTKPQIKERIQQAINALAINPWFPNENKQAYNSINMNR